MNHKSYSYFLVIDLEATCADDKSIRRRETEIIEIGAVIVNSQTWEVESEFQRFIKPIRHPKLTQFCTDLTTIKQTDVENASKFPEVILELKELLKSFPNYLFCSWGDYDKNQFIQDCQFHQISYPFTSDHLNLKKEFSAYLGTSDKFGMAGALAKIGIELEGTHHRGIDDARNIAKILVHMQTKEAF